MNNTNFEDFPHKASSNGSSLAKSEMALPQFPAPFPALEQVTKPNLTTAELAYYSNMAEQTWRCKACYGSSPEGLRPLRVCGRLAWPTAGAKKLLGVN